MSDRLAVSVYSNSDIDKNLEKAIEKELEWAMMRLGYRKVEADKSDINNMVCFEYEKFADYTG